MRLHNPIQVVQTSAGYPMTMVYVGGVALAVCVSQGWVDLALGLAIFTFITVCSFLIAVMREIKNVRRQLALQAKAHSAQTVELANQIETLIEALIEAGVEVPGIHKQSGRPS